jgi:apolipoprotein N-acyltransferase
VAAIAYGLSFPKAQLEILAFIFMLPLLLALENRKPWAAFRVFFCFSLASYLIILYWIPRVMVRYGGTTWFLGFVGLACLSAFFSLLAGLAGMLIGRTVASGPCIAAAFWVPAIWVARDLVVEKIFGGFPWCLAGYSQFKNTVFIQLAELGGIHLITFLVIAVNVLLYRMLKKRDKASLAAIASLVAAVYACGFWLLGRQGKRAAALPRHLAGIIQPNSNHDEAFTFPRIQSELNKLLHASRELERAGAEFVVWPEFTVPIYPLQAPHFRRQLDAFSRQHVPLLAGFTDYGGAEEVFNSVMLFRGGEVQKYDKVHLTPFGEYVLFRRLLFFVKKITDEIGDFTPGDKLHTLDLSGRRLATPICYEIIYPELVRVMIAQGGEVIVTISNDSWFGRSSAPYQHLAMAAFRSVENRRWLLRSTSNGVSALVDPAGRIIRQSPLHQEDRFLARFQYLSGRTSFSRWGYLFPYACMLLVMGKIVFAWARKKGKRCQP